MGEIWTSTTPPGNGTPCGNGIPGEQAFCGPPRAADISAPAFCGCPNIRNVFMEALDVVSLFVHIYIYIYIYIHTAVSILFVCLKPCTTARFLIGFE